MTVEATIREPLSETAAVTQGRHKSLPVHQGESLMELKQYGPAGDGFSATPTNGRLK